MPEWMRGEVASTWIHLAGLLALAFVIYGIARWCLVVGLRRVAAASRSTWDDALTEARVFARLAHVAPALVIYFGIHFVPNVGDTVESFIRRLLVAFILVVAAITATAFLAAINEIYSRIEEYRHRPIKGYLQIVSLFIYGVAALLVLATLLDKSPWIFLSGLGALAAVLMLVFRDTILSLVASVQIASNDMIHLGDWIEMPQAGVDGDVIDVALHTVKIQNWDKTISTVPTYKFISESFKNWRGMSESGGRRIKRSLHIDLNSIRFLAEEEIDRFESWVLLRDYVAAKRSEIVRANAESGGDPAVNADIRRLTNVGTLRAYIFAYLKAHPKIHSTGYTLIVRQLTPESSGLPLEIYCFSNDQDWMRFEGIQSDLFDHILAMVQEFDLRLFQIPGGQDFDRLGEGSGASRAGN